MSATAERITPEISKATLEQDALPCRGTLDKLPTGLLAFPKYHRLQKLISMVAMRKIHAAMIAGEHGTAKTTYSKNVLESHGLKEGVDFVIIRGHSTPMAFYQALYENRNRIVIIDDCDSIIKNPEAVNLAKGALDDKFRRTISYLTMRVRDDLPQSFEFTGAAIFLTNLRFNLNDIDGAALRDRCHYHELFLTPSEKLDYIEKVILPKEYRNTTSADRGFVFKVLRDAVAAGGVDFSFRTYMQLLEIYECDSENIEIHLREMTRPNSEVVEFLSASRKHHNCVADAVTEFVWRTGLSKRTFFNYKREFGDLLRL